MNELLTVYFNYSYSIRAWKMNTIRDRNNWNYFKIHYSRNKNLNKRGKKVYQYISKRRMNKKTARNS